MCNVIVNFKPFTLEQNIMVYEDGVCVQQINAPIDRISDIVHGLKNQYSIDRINLCGNADYLSKFKAELSLKFSNNVDIDIINI